MSGGDGVAREAEADGEILARDGGLDDGPGPGAGVIRRLEGLSKAYAALGRNFKDTAHELWPPLVRICCAAHDEEDGRVGGLGIVAVTTGRVEDRFYSSDARWHVQVILGLDRAQRVGDLR